MQKPLVCTAYLFAKGKKKSIESSATSNLSEAESTLNNKDAQPGDKVSCDQYMSPTKIRLIHTHGKESSMKQLCGGIIFVDHANRYIFNNHKVNLTAATIVESKHTCKSKFDEFGVQIKQYATNNHPFCSKVWVEDCAVQLQLPTSHSHVGAHHQALAVRHMQTIFNWSRADLLHFILHWPHMATNQENLWPFVIDYAVYMHNHLSISNMRISPSKQFTNTVFQTTIILPRHILLAVWSMFLTYVYKTLRRSQNGI